MKIVKQRSSDHAAVEMRFDIDCEGDESYLTPQHLSGSPFIPDLVIVYASGTSFDSLDSIKVHALGPDPKDIATGLYGRRNTVANDWNNGSLNPAYSLRFAPAWVREFVEANTPFAHIFDLTPEPRTR